MILFPFPGNEWCGCGCGWESTRERHVHNIYITTVLILLECLNEYACMGCMSTPIELLCSWSSSWPSLNIINRTIYFSNQKSPAVSLKMLKMLIMSIDNPIDNPNISKVNANIDLVRLMHVDSLAHCSLLPDRASPSHPNAARNEIKPSFQFPIQAVHSHH